MPVVSTSEERDLPSRPVDAVEGGDEREVVVACRGRPGARPVPSHTSTSNPRLGVARGRFEAPDDIDADDAEIVGAFGARP